MINLLAFDISDNMVGLASVIFVMLIPIVAILSKHQLKMAALFREQAANRNVEQNPDMMSLEMRELKAMVAQQALAIESLAHTQRKLMEHTAANQPVDQQLQNRL
jgi:hypothetical protein